jgi:hypothetical protein
MKQMLGHEAFEENGRRRRYSRGFWFAALEGTLIRSAGIAVSSVLTQGFNGNWRRCETEG